jgi:hypothetical protein
VSFKKSRRFIAVTPVLVSGGSQQPACQLGCGLIGALIGKSCCLIGGHPQ